MFFDLVFNENGNTVTFSGAENTYTFGVDDLNKHTASWLVNNLLGRVESEKL